jgi:hypothetical protein
VRIRAALLSAVLAASGALALAPAAAASGTSYTYVADGTDGSNWNDPNNWSPSGVPGNGDSVYIAPPTPDHCSADLTNAPSLTLADLTVSMDGPCDGNTYLSGGTLTVEHTFTWHGGQINDPLVLPTGATGSISPGARTSSAVDELGSTLDVQGTLALTDDETTNAVDKSLLFGNAGEDDNGTLANGILVEPGARLTSSGTNDINALACCTNPTRIVNHGMIEVADGSVLRFDNAVLDQDGTLQTDGSSAEVDNFAGDRDEPNTAANAAYSGPGTYRLSIGSAALAASGTLRVGSGFHFVLGGQASSSVVPDGDENIAGTFTLTGAGEFDWLGGQLTGRPTISTGTTRIGTTGVAGSGGSDGDPGESTYIDATAGNAPSTVLIDSSVVFAAGADADTPDTMEINDGSTLELTGTTTVPANVRWFGHGHLTNRGNLTVNAGRAGDYVTGSAVFTNSGSVQVRSGTLKTDDDYHQTGGTTALSATGQIRVVGSSAAVRLAGGQLTGIGSIYGNVVNTGGVLSPNGSGIGALTVHGSYTQGAKAGLDVDLARSAEDLLAVQGAVRLRGRFTVRNQYTPTSMRRPTIVTATSRPTVDLRCTTTSGPGSSGKHARHWIASAAGKNVTLASAAGRDTSC